MELEKEIEELKKRVSILEELLTLKTKSATQPTVSKESNRDKTKYMFLGKILPKNRLVLAIVQSYVEKSNPTYSELAYTFDKSLQGSLNVIETLDNAKKISDAKKRYFLDNVITLKDNTQIVICTQWGIFNIKKFILQARNLGFEIIEI